MLGNVWEKFKTLKTFPPFTHRHNSFFGGQLKLVKLKGGINNVVPQFEAIIYEN